MNLHVSLWFAAGLSVGLAAGWLPWAGLRQFVAQPVIQVFTWPACGALIVMLSAQGMSAWRAHANPGGAWLAGASPGSAVLTDSGAVTGASIGARMGASVQPGGVDGKDNAAGSLDPMLAKLEQRLRGGSIDPNDWELLAQTYSYLGRVDDASNARERQIVAAAAMLADADDQGPQILAALDADGADGADGADRGKALSARAERPDGGGDQ
jgi:hypothetical protein